MDLAGVEAFVKERMGKEVRCSIPVLVLLSTHHASYVPLLHFPPPRSSSDT